MMRATSSIHGKRQELLLTLEEFVEFALDADDNADVDEDDADEDDADDGACGER